MRSLRGNVRGSGRGGRGGRGAGRGVTQRGGGQTKSKAAIESVPRISGAGNRGGQGGGRGGAGYADEDDDAEGFEDIGADGSVPHRTLRRRKVKRVEDDEDELTSGKVRR